MEKEQIHVAATACMPGFTAALRSIDQSQRFNMDAHSFQPRLHLAEIALKLLA